MENINALKTYCFDLDETLCKTFKTDYKNKRSYLGVVKFNLVAYLHGSSFVPLGGIRLNNLNKLKEVNASSFVLMSEIKKKPAVISRLF